MITFVSEQSIWYESLQFTKLCELKEHSLQYEILWQNLNQSIFATTVVTNLQSGWANVQHVANGELLWKS